MGFDVVTYYLMVRVVVSLTLCVEQAVGRYGRVKSMWLVRVIGELSILFH